MKIEREGKSKKAIAKRKNGTKPSHAQSEEEVLGVAGGVPVEEVCVILNVGAIKN